MANIIGKGGSKPQKASEQSTQQSPKIDLGKSTPVVCAHCGYDKVMLCGNCGEICEELLPEQMKVLSEIDKRNSEESAS